MMGRLEAIDGLDAVRHQINGLVAFMRLGREEDPDWRVDGVEALLTRLGGQVSDISAALSAAHKKNLAPPVPKQVSD
jgi:hypothetical protein